MAINTDADIVVDGLLLDFKSTKHPQAFRKDVVWQLLGYLLLAVRHLDADEELPAALHGATGRSMSRGRDWSTRRPDRPAGAVATGCSMTRGTRSTT
ncbi:hypothetical protein GCM10010381_33330 [Streptomyces xantholiticus]|nr:hypothetical protein GCM10010381_33330 [Streptomyces xantholiticus]